MTQYNRALHHRRSTRLEGYDYSQAGLYFITLCCHDQLPLFGSIHDGVMVLSPWGEIVEQEWLRTPDLRPNVALHEYVVMLNHFHAIPEIKYRVVGKEQAETTTTFKSPSQSVGAIIRGFKSAVTTLIRKGEDGSKGELQFAPTATIWQRDYY